MTRLLLLTAAVLVTLVLLSKPAGSNLTTSCVVLSPLTITLEVGKDTTATATAYDEIGNVIPDAQIVWLPTEDDPGEHCVSVVGGVITARAAGKCGVGALTVTRAGRLILHQTAISVTVVEPTPTPQPTRDPCRLPNGKCKRGCICL